MTSTRAGRASSESTGADGASAGAGDLVLDRRSLRGGLDVHRDLAAQQGAHLRLAEAPMPTGRADAADAAGSRPARDGLRVDPEQAGDLTWREQALASVGHVVLP